MAWHHHLRHVATAHHHLKRASHSLMVKAAEHHPILTSALAIVGGVSLVRLVTEKKSTTPTVSTTEVGL